MNRTKAIDLPTFKLLLSYAQAIHAYHDEPIPKLNIDTQAIESCLITPFARFEGKDLYRGLSTKAAMLFYLINKNHPLINGNKRMACLCLDYLCTLNGYELSIPADVFYQSAKDTVMSRNETKDEELKKIKKLIEHHWRRRK